MQVTKPNIRPVFFLLLSGAVLLLAGAGCTRDYPNTSLASLLLLEETTATTTSTTPTVSGISPADGTTGLSVLGETITVTFSEEMDPTTVVMQTTFGTCSSSVRISTDNFSTCIGGTLSTSDNISFSYTPAVTNPMAGVNGRVIITTAARSAQGVALASQYVSSQGFTLYTPASVAGLVVWLQADAISGLTDTATISVWNDSSGQSNNAFQATAANRPLYRNTAGSNGMPWVEFQSANLQYLDLAEFMTFTDPTVIIVGAAIVGANQMFFSDYGGAIPARFNIGVDATNAIFPIIQESTVDGGTDIYGGSVIAANVSGTVATPSIMSLTKTGTASNFYVDGTQINGPTTASDATYNNATTYDGTTGVDNPRIGKRSLNALNEHLNGAIYEILIYNNSLSATDRARIECYLSRKYSITGPTC